MSETTAAFQSLLAGIQAGETGAAKTLIERSYPRLQTLADKLLRESFPCLRELEVAEVVHEAFSRLVRALESVRPTTPADFFGLAAHKFRQTLIDLTNDTRQRVCEVSLESAGNASAWPEKGTTTHDPARLAMWTEAHLAVDRLPDDVRGVFVQHFYLGLTQAEISEASGLPPRKVSRLWGKALLILRERDSGFAPAHSVNHPPKP